MVKNYSVYETPDMRVYQVELRSSCLLNDSSKNKIDIVDDNYYGSMGVDPFEDEN